MLNDIWKLVFGETAFLKDESDGEIIRTKVKSLGGKLCIKKKYDGWLLAHPGGKVGCDSRFTWWK